MHRFRLFFAVLALIIITASCGNNGGTVSNAPTDTAPGTAAGIADTPQIPESAPEPEVFTEPAAESAESAPEQEPAPPAGPSALDIARIDGSTATIPLVQAGLAEFTGGYDGLVHNRTNEAYMNLFSGKKDVIFVTYPSEEELDTAKTRGFDMEIVPVVKDALVFLNNAANPVSDLTSKQIQDIYTGEITNWRELGGNDAEIVPFQRPVNSGSQTLFLKLAMDGKTPMDAPETLKPAMMGDLVDAVANYDNGVNALGFSVFYYAAEMYLRDAAKLAAVNGVIPSAETIAAGEYEYLTHYYAVFDKNLPEDAPARRFVEWFLTEDGQRTALAAGYVPLAPIDGEPGGPVYGYYGSTPENTTRSIGTGGAEYKGKPAYINYAEVIWNPDEDITDFVIKGYPESSAAVSAWLAGVELPDAYTQIIPHIDFFGDLISLSVWVHTGDIGWYNYNSDRECAVFNIHTGERLVLSDLFYDGVNYIDFINQNLLLDTAPNLYYGEADHTSSFDEKCIIRPFTGIPSDYEKFRIYDDNGLAKLAVYFDNDNPFFKTDETFNTPSVYLPADLSPYTRIWKIDFDIQEPIPQIKVGIPQIVTDYLAPSETDKKINAAIMDAYEQTVDMGVYGDYVERLDHWNTEYAMVWRAGTHIWEGNITVVFAHIPYYGIEGIFTPAAVMLTFDIATGEPVDTGYLYDELMAMMPEDMWEYLSDYPRYGKYAEYPGFGAVYDPPEGTALTNFRKISGGSALIFDIREPGGEVYTMYYYTGQ